MFKRRLKALNHMDWDKVNVYDIQHFRKIIVWLEDQKIRLYTIQDRDELRNIHSKNWQKVYKKYLDDLGCPITTNPQEELEWLLALAVELAFDDAPNNHEAVKNKHNEKKDATVPCIKSANSPDNLDFKSSDIKASVNTIAKLLKITPHPNYSTTLEACSILVRNRFNSSALANPSSVIVKGKPFPIMEIDLGFNMGDRVLNNAAKALILLYIQDLRNLQTKINEAIVSIQNITANPKTDTKLGKVGI